MPGLDDRRDEQVRAEAGTRRRCRARPGRPGGRRRAAAAPARPSRSRAQERRVEVGQQPVAQLDRRRARGPSIVSPHVHAYWSTLPISEWLRQNGVSVPYCIQRRNSSAFEWPLEAADVGADERLAREPEAHRHRDAEPEVVPARAGCRPSSSPRSAGCRRTPRARGRTCAGRASRRAARRSSPSPSAARTGCGSARGRTRPWSKRIASGGMRPVAGSFMSFQIPATPERTWSALSSPHHARPSSVTKSGNAVSPGQTSPR